MQKDFTILETGCVHVGTTGDGRKIERQMKNGKHKMLSNSFFDEGDERTLEKISLGPQSWVMHGI